MTAGFSVIRDPLYPVREARRYYAGQLPEVRDIATESPDEMENKADGCGEEMPGEWVSIGAGKGLPTGVVEDLKPFLRTMEGLSPDGKSRVRGAGKTGHVAGADLTFSLPKGLSLYLNALDECGRLDDAEAIRKDARDAVREALVIVHEQGAFTARRGSASRGTIRREVVAGVPATIWHHRVSRANDGGKNPSGDPQEHIHAYIPNVGRRMDGTWGAIERAPIAEAKMVAGALFRADLSHRLARRGIAVREEGRGQFDLAIPRHVVEDFSNRRTAILDRMELETGERRTDGRRARKAAAVAIATRAPKDQLPSMAEMKRDWTARLEGRGIGWEAISQVAEQAKGREDRASVPVTEILSKVEKGVLSKSDVVAAVAAHACADGSMSAREALRRAGEIARDLPKLERGRKGQAMASPEAARRELNILQNSVGRKREAARLSPADARRAVEDFEYAVGGKPTGKQKADLLRLVGAPGGVQVLSGATGTGKTEVVAAAARAHARAGYKVTALAPSWASVEKLTGRFDAYDSRTVQGMAADLAAGRERLGKDHALVVDDGGSISTKEMETILSHARLSGAKVILAGDERRAAAKGDLGNAFRAIVEADASHRLRAGLPTDPALRRAAVDLDAGRVGRCLERLVEDGRVRAVRDEAVARRQTADRVANWIVGDRSVGRPIRDACRENIALCTTHEEARLVAAEVRQRLQEAGIVGREEVVVPAGGGEAGGRQVEHELRLAAGDRVMLYEAVPVLGLVAGDVLAVERVRGDDRGDAVIDLCLEREDRTIQVGPADLRSGDRPLKLQYASAIAVSAARGIAADRVAVCCSAKWDREKASVAFSRHRMECRATVAVERHEAEKGRGTESRKEREREALKAWATGCNRKFERTNVTDHLTRSQALAWMRQGRIAAVPGVEGEALDRVVPAFNRADARQITANARAMEMAMTDLGIPAARSAAAASLAAARATIAAARGDEAPAGEKRAEVDGPERQDVERKDEQQRQAELVQVQRIADRLVEMEKERRREMERGRSF